MVRLHVGRKTRSRAGFTLMELLVVIGIIALLTAILFPALEAIRRQSRKTRCMANMNQLGKAVLAYVNDNQGTLPDQTYWIVSDFGEKGAPTNYLTSMLKYLSNDTRTVLCPEVQERANTQSILAPPTDHSDSNYVANGAVLGLSIARVRNTAGTVWIQELAERGNTAQLRPTPLEGTGVVGTFALWHDSEVLIDPNARYLGETVSVSHGIPPINVGGNLLFVDGHVEWRRAASLRSGEFGLVPDELYSHYNSIVSNTGAYYTRKY